MPKLADLIQRATRGEPAPLGFSTGRTKVPPTIVLVAVVPQRWKQTVTGAADADVVLLSGRPNDNELAEAVAAADGRPCGLLDPDASGLAKLTGAGLGFAVLPLDTPASALQNHDLGVILRGSVDLTDVQLRTIDGLSIEALYLGQPPAVRTISDLLELRRLSGLARKPLLLHAPAAATQDDLLSLREAGAALLAVDMERGGPDELSRLREMINALPGRQRRKGDRPDVTVPSTSQASDDEDDDEDDD